MLKFIFDNSALGIFEYLETECRCVDGDVRKFTYNSLVEYCLNPENWGKVPQINENDIQLVIFPNTGHVVTLAIVGAYKDRIYNKMYTINMYPANTELLFDVSHYW